MTPGARASHSAAAAIASPSSPAIALTRLGAASRARSCTAARRQPRTPISGALLVVAGGVALAFTLQSTTNPLAFYGTYWPLLLFVVAVVEILKHYTWRPEMGERRPALFGAGKLALVGVLVAMPAFFQATRSGTTGSSDSWWVGI